MYGVLIFGDSIVVGKGTTKEKSWPSMLAKSFDIINKYDCTVYNLGIPSQSTNELIKRFKTECEVRIKKHSLSDCFVIVIAIGINDSKTIGPPNEFRTSPQKFSHNIHLLIKIAKEYCKDIFFIGLTPVDEIKTKTNFYNRNIKIYNDIIKKRCKENDVILFDLFTDWISCNYKNLLADDGIHLNELGHNKIFEKIVSTLTVDNSINLDLFSALKREHSLSDDDIASLKSIFINSKDFPDSLFLGQFFEKEPSVIFGGPCIKKDIEKISLNTFYQLFMPLRVASILNKPCKIVLALKEEIILRPELSAEYTKLGLRLERGINRIAKELNVDVQILNTLNPEVDELIQDCIKRLKIQLPEQDSRYLFSLSLRKKKKAEHTQNRIIVNKRVLACHSLYFMERISRSNSPLIVEDIEQHKCVLYVKKFEQNKVSNFLAFLPLPNISGTAPMFKSEEKDRILLSQSKNYYESLFKSSSGWVLVAFRQLLRLVSDIDITQNGPIRISETINRISRYFD